MLAAMKLRAGFAPLNGLYPKDRLAYICKDCSAKLAVTPDFFKDIEKTEPLTETETPDPEDIAVLIYTSGSTGNPKGVMIDQLGLYSSCKRFSEGMEWQDDDILGLGAPFFFVAGLQSLLVAFSLGVTGVLIPISAMRDPKYLAQLLAETSVSVTFISPKVLRYFTPANDRLRRVVAGSERLSGIASDRFELINSYGLSESIGGILSYNVQEPMDNTPVGSSMGKERVYLLDESGNEADEGEICLTGHLARGYVNRPEETASVFVPNPFFERDGFKTMLRTGDLGCRNSDGSITYLNRKDWMVKINGQRVEPGEIEAVLRKVNGISDAAVMDHTDEDGQTFLTAYYVSAEEMPVSELKEALAQKLPEYMIPASFMQLTKLPVNANGKLDRASLPKPDQRPVSVSLPQPENDVQKKIFECIAKAIGHANFGIETNIFEAGISSIGVIRLSTLLDEAFDTPVSIQDLQVHSTVKDLEAFLSSQTKREAYALQEDYPLTRTQMGILVESSNSPETTIYNIPMLFKLSEKVDTQRLKKAVEQAIEAHPYLKAVIFADEQGSFRVRRNDSLPAEVSIIEAAQLPDPIARPFDLIGGRLYRAEIYLTDEAPYLFLDFHHIVNDGTGTAVFIKDVNDAYAGNTPAKETYTGYEIALDEQKLRQTERYNEAKAYFDRLLLDADREMLPLGDSNGKQPEAGTLLLGSEINLPAIRTFLSENDFSANAFFSAVFAFVLSKFTGKKDTLYTTIYNGRSDSRAARSITMMVKTYPVLCRLNPEDSIKAFVKSVSSMLMSGMTHDIYSFAEIAQEYGIASDVLFAYQGNEFLHDTIGGEKAQMIPIPQTEAKSPINIGLFVKDGKLLYNCEFRKDMFSEDYIRRFAACLEKAAVEFTQKTLLKDIVLTDDRTEEEMDAFNNTEAPYPVTDIVSMFRAAADKFPERPAVVFKEEELSYRQLDTLSDRIAGFLREKGIGKGDIVPILIPRCSYMPIAALGVLKCGAAYEPLDPSYPAERLIFMIKDAGSRLLIADKDLFEKVPEYTGEVLLTKDIPSLKECARTEDCPAPEDAFILLYTSGTTGVPKGAILEHRNVANICDWYRDYFKMDETCRTGAYASFGFDANMMDMYPTLTAGACLCIVEDEIGPDGSGRVVQPPRHHQRDYDHAGWTSVLHIGHCPDTQVPDSRRRKAGAGDTEK